MGDGDQAAGAAHGEARDGVVERLLDARGFERGIDAAAGDGPYLVGHVAHIGVEGVRRAERIEYAATLERRLDGGYRGAWGKLDHDLRHPPSEYFRRNVYMTYITDPVGLNNIRFTGADHFLWSGDYPHNASTWPNSEDRVARECDDVGLDSDVVRKLTVENTAELYDFDLDIVARPSERVLAAP